MHQGMPRACMRGMPPPPSCALPPPQPLHCSAPLLLPSLTRRPCLSGSRMAIGGLVLWRAAMMPPEPPEAALLPALFSIPPSRREACEPPPLSLTGCLVVTACGTVERYAASAWLRPLLSTGKAAAGPGYVHVRQYDGKALAVVNTTYVCAPPSALGSSAAAGGLPGGTRACSGVAGASDNGACRAAAAASARAPTAAVRHGGADTAGGGATTASDGAAGAEPGEPNWMARLRRVALGSVALLLAVLFALLLLPEEQWSAVLGDAHMHAERWAAAAAVSLLQGVVELLQEWICQLSEGADNDSFRSSQASLYLRLRDAEVGIVRPLGGLLGLDD
eukprot:364317-Chlamydomonas_euryale.AAC.1